MNLREMAEAYIVSPQFGSTTALHEMLECVSQRSEQAAFEMAALASCHGPHRGADGRLCEVIRDCQARIRELAKRSALRAAWAKWRCACGSAAWQRSGSRVVCSACKREPAKEQAK